MIVSLFSRDNVSISDIDDLGYNDLVYWYDCHLQIIEAIKAQQQIKKQNRKR